MQDPHAKGMFRPFEHLHTLLHRKSFAVRTGGNNARALVPSPPADQGDDLAIFETAMADVKRLARDNCIDTIRGVPRRSHSHTDGASDCLLQLEDLINQGTGFVVAHTPEYIDGIAHDTHPAVIERLHRGDFSIQGHIDLHGFNVEKARCAVEDFFQQSISTGKRVVLIIHGRGLSSPGEPVLKSNVYKWLTTGPWRKWVLAFSSARSCDGGAGATYVLLRKRPPTKCSRRKHTAQER